MDGRPTSIIRTLALLLALLPLACARPATAPGTAVVSTPAPVPPAAPTWPDAAQVPQTPAPDEAAATPAEAAKETFVSRPELPDVHFASGEVRVERRDLTTLDATATWLKANPAQLVIVEGHTDVVGPRAANRALAQRRARWVMDYLVAKGVPAARITVVTRGESETVCADKSPACQRRNRRVHFLVRDSSPVQLSASPNP
jgi:outer membrane protein OmpA-like peptidoglycan-associated protein